MALNIGLIELTKNQVVLIDSADFDEVKLYSWCWTNAGAQARLPGGERVLMHRFIMQPEPDQQVDHINRCRFDNRRINLRIVTSQQNSQNSMTYERTGIKGVTDSRKGKPPSNSQQFRRYRALITCDGVPYKIGAFPTEELAARAYDLKATELFGEYACLNYPDEDSKAILDAFYEQFPQALEQDKRGRPRNNDV